MGAFQRFKFWLSRLRYHFIVWRQRRLEKYQNAIIAMQQAQLASMAASWDSESAAHHKRLVDLNESWDRERRELQLQIQLLTTANAEQETYIARNRARVEAEVAAAVLYEQECLNAVGKGIKKS